MKAIIKASAAAAHERLSGWTTAQAVAAKLALTDVESDVLPEVEHRVASELKRKGRIVAMSGDGVDDAPALAAADVAIGHSDHRRRFVCRLRSLLSPMIVALAMSFGCVSVIANALRLRTVKLQ